ncbi:protein-disulfide reductase DsbD domain-containing protein [Thalassovita sp.]|uniref:protein-disulfide reductase DsbD domain-containing protein n=1 Tax=Thalassovita sp. TaxID=1979401 RepID=UPI0029DE687C|nr:protein-disulfide reductase DsbD domain-containing protein [Thalassovita sp.]
MIITLALSALLALGLATGAAAQGPAQTVVSLQVLPGWRTADGTHIAALRIQLAPGWKTYWRAPGDAGIPPLINWSASTNLAAMLPAWPTPSVFSQNGMNSIGYKGELVLPVVLTPRDADQPITLAGQLQIGICNDICVPAEFSFDTRLPVTGHRDGAISAALANQPYPAHQAGVGQVTCDLTLRPDGLELTARLIMPPAGAQEYAVVETADPQVWVAESTTRRSGDTLTVTTELVHMDGGAFALDRSGLRLTILGSDRAVDIQGCPAD